MLKPALIELDSAAVELRDLTVDVVRTFLPRYQWPEHHAQLFHRAVVLIFDDALNQHLSWTPKGPDTLAQRVVAELGLTGIIDASLSPNDIAEFYCHMDSVVSDRVFQCLITQIQGVIGSDRYNAWHVMPLGTGRILTPGGIMIDLDRLKDESGVIEINLAEHWSPLAKAGGPQVETGATLPKADTPDTGPVVFPEQLPPKPGVKNLDERPSRSGKRIPRLNDDTIVADMEKDKEAHPVKRSKRRLYVVRARTLG